MWAIVVHVALLTILEQRAVGIMGLRNIAMEPVIGGKGRIFVVHSLSIITLCIVENDFRSGLPNQASFSFSIWPRRE